MRIEIGVSGKTSFKVLQKTDSVYNMDVSYQELSMTMNLPSGIVTYSSEKADEEPVSKLFRAFKGKQFGITMTRFGKILEITRLDTIFESLVNEMTQGTPQQKQQIKAQLQQSFGEKAFRGSFEQITLIYTNAPVELGSKWTVQTTIESVVSAKMTTTFELKQKEATFNLITAFSTIGPKKNGQTAEVNGMPAEYNLNGTSEWILKVDSKTGWIIEGQTKQSLSGKVLIKDNPKLPGGMEIPLKVNNDAKYSGNS
jgi:hypothetical protein